MKEKLSYALRYLHVSFCILYLEQMLVEMRFIPQVCVCVPLCVGDAVSQLGWGLQAGTEQTASQLCVLNIVGTWHCAHYLG